MEELELEQALASADRPRVLRPEELERLRKSYQDATPEDIKVEPLFPAPSPALERRRARPAVVALGAAAVVILVLTSLLVFNRSDDEPARMAAEGLDAAEAVSAICRGSVEPLTEAIEVWGGLANWSATVNARPDVGPLALEVLLQAQSIDSIRDRATVAYDGLRTELGATGEDQILGGDRLVRRTSALETSLLAMRELLEPIDTKGTCDFDRLMAAAALR